MNFLSGTEITCPYYRGYFYKECVGIFPGPSELFVLERCPKGEVRLYIYFSLWGLRLLSMYIFSF